MAGVAGNLAVLALWLTTRAVGLPFGLMPEPHPVGTWDLTCAAWELVVVLGCALTLRRGVPPRIASWFEWHPAAQSALVGSGLALITLTLLGGHA